jgi:putative transcriptional regulator
VAGTPLSPSLLVALDTILDPNFRRTVVLVLHHDESEAFGLVLNRSTEVTIDALCTSIDLAWNGSDLAQVDWGGPVQPDHGWVLLGEPSPDGDGEVEDVMPGIHFSRSQDVLRDAASSPPHQLRVFLGYAGWGAGQLEREIADGSWLVVPVSQGLVFDTPPERLWDAAVRSLGIEPATLVATQGVN